MSATVDPKLQKKLAELKAKRNRQALPAQVVNTPDQMANLKNAVIVGPEAQGGWCGPLFGAAVSVLALVAGIVAVLS